MGNGRRRSDRGLEGDFLDAGDRQEHNGRLHDLHGFGSSRNLDAVGCVRSRNSDD